MVTKKKHASRYLPLRESIAKTHRALYEASEHLSDHAQCAAEDSLEVAAAHIRDALHLIRTARVMP